MQNVCMMYTVMYMMMYQLKKRQESWTENKWQRFRLSRMAFAPLTKMTCLLAVKMEIQDPQSDHLFALSLIQSTRSSFLINHSYDSDLI